MENYARITSRLLRQLADPLEEYFYNTTIQYCSTLWRTEIAKNRNCNDNFSTRSARSKNIEGTI